MFRSGVGKQLSQGIHKFTSHIHEDRFGTMADCIPKLLKLRTTLQWGWNYQSFTGTARSSGPVGDDDEDDDHEQRVDLVDDAIRSVFFWSYLMAIEGLATALRTAMAWIESCTCHWALEYDDASKHLQGLWKSCPMCCRRCPEIAAGDLQRVFQAALGLSASQLALRLDESCPSLSTEDRGAILKDFEAGRNHLALYVLIKLNYWTKPPWCVLAMAHFRPEVALAAEQMARESDSQHPLLQELRGPLHSQVRQWRENIDAFRDNRDPEHLKELREFLCKLRFAPHNSRYVEAEHTKIQIGLRKARHHSDAYVSLLRRQPALMEELKRNPELIEELAAFVGKVRHGRDAVVALGLAQHPSCKKAWGDGSDSREFWDVVYHADAWTKFLMPAPSITKDEPGGPGRAFIGEDDEALRGMTEQQSLRHYYMVEHLASMSQKNPALAYSIRFEAAGGAFHSLYDVLHGDGAPAGAAAESVRSPGTWDVNTSLTVQIPGAGERAALLSDMVFFKIVSATPSNIKRPSTLAERDIRGSLAVSVHPILRLDNRERAVLLGVDSLNREGVYGCAVPVVFSPAILTIAALRRLYQWQPQSSHEHFICNFLVWGLHPQIILS